MSVEELESAVSNLSASEFARFSEWFAEFAADRWDRQIEQDLHAGRLDTAIKRADDHYDAGRCTGRAEARPSEEIQRAHIDEVRKRIAEVESGEVEMLPGDEALARVRNV